MFSPATVRRPRQDPASGVLEDLSRIDGAAGHNRSRMVTWRCARSSGPSAI